VDDNRSEERFSEEVRLPFFGVREKQAASMLGTRKSLLPFSLDFTHRHLHACWLEIKAKRHSFIFLLP